MKHRLFEVFERCEFNYQRNTFISKVLCICEFGSSRYFGASLSCRSKTEREIMTAVSCAYVWHQIVSSAVTTSIISENNRQRKKSITIPSEVKCSAYSLKNMEPKAPCLRCHELFGLSGHAKNRNLPGNCAETEAISNLLNAEHRVRDGTVISNGAFNQSVVKQRMKAVFDDAISEWESNDPEQNQSQYSFDQLYECVTDY